jgi:hypothetical protein
MRYRKQKIMQLTQDYCSSREKAISSYDNAIDTLLTNQSYFFKRGESLKINTLVRKKLTNDTRRHYNFQLRY